MQRSHHRNLTKRWSKHDLNDPSHPSWRSRFYPSSIATLTTKCQAGHPNQATKQEDHTKYTKWRKIQKNGRLPPQRGATLPSPCYERAAWRHVYLMWRPPHQEMLKRHVYPNTRITSKKEDKQRHFWRFKVKRRKYPPSISRDNRGGEVNCFGAKWLPHQVASPLSMWLPSENL